MYTSKIKHLEESHRVLDTKINAQLASGVFKDSEIQELKKKKLMLKDEIRRLNKLQWEYDHETVHLDD